MGDVSNGRSGQPAPVTTGRTAGIGTRPVRRVRGAHRGQAGFTLLEAVLVVTIASIGILAIALGLLTSIRGDSLANRQQRLNLAMTTFADSVKRADWIAPACPAVGTTPPRTNDPNLKLDATPAGRILYGIAGDDAAVAGVPRPDPGVRQLRTQGVVFSITDVQYWDDTKFTGDGFLTTCATQNMSWPVAKLKVKVCFTGSGPDGCDVDGPVVTSGVSMMGPRSLTQGATP